MKKTTKPKQKEEVDEHFGCKRATKCSKWGIKIENERCILVLMCDWQWEWKRERGTLSSFIVSNDVDDFFFSVESWMNRCDACMRVWPKRSIKIINTSFVFRFCSAVNGESKQSHDENDKVNEHWTEIIDHKCCLFGCCSHKRYISITIATTPMLQREISLSFPSTHSSSWCGVMRFFFRRHQQKSKRKEVELTKFNFRFYFGSFYIAGRGRGCLSSGSIKSKTIDWHVISIYSAVIVSLSFGALLSTALLTYLVLWPTAYHFKTSGYILRVFASSMLIFRQQQMKET